MQDVAIAGVGMTAFGRQLDRDLRSLAEQATSEAMSDAGVTPSDLGFVAFSNATGGLVTGQEMIPGQSALRHTGLLGLPLVNVENACASASTAFNLAWMGVASGMHDAAIVVGAEKLAHEDKRVPMRAIGSAVDLLQLPQLLASLGQEDDGAGETKTLFMDIYAQLSHGYAERSGASVEDFADISVKNHRHGVHNPLAQYRELVTREQVLGSRTISDPLTLLMCSPIGDGAAAAVLMSPEFAKSRGVTDPIWVLASTVLSGSDEATDTVVERAARRAYESAGVGPADVNVVEVHDAAAPAELIVYEELGLCAPGDGPALLRSGATALGGRVPVNPSGGLLSKGHPIGATGLAQIAELVWQLRGQAGDRQVSGARIGLAENGGGFLGPDLAAASITILGR